MVSRAQAGDLDAYAEVVLRFQDMAYGYSYSLLGDFHQAEDAAQEAFIEAYRNLGQLRDPAAFPGWFRRVVFSRCQRILRRKRPCTEALEGTLPAQDKEPSEMMARAELKDSVLAAIRSLPEPERMVTTLFYINGYSQEDIAGFLEVPVTTVKSRLHTSRGRLKERMMNMVADEMKSHPLSEDFPERIRLLLELPRPLAIEGHPVSEAWKVFRKCFDDFEVVQLDEIHPRSTFIQEGASWQRSIISVDRQRMLRIDLTTQLVDLWLQRGRPACRWLACGRVFRNDKPDAGHLEVFHQAEMFWYGPEVTESLGEVALRRAGNVLLPGFDMRPTEPYSYVPVKEAHDWQVSWKGRDIGVAGGGLFDEAWLKSVGAAEGSMKGYGFAFGLERVAQVRYDLDDIRKLWQPPYVTK